MISLQSRWLIDRFHSCGQRLCKFLEQKKFFTLEKSSIQRGFLLYTKMAAVSLFCTPIWSPWRHVNTIYIEGGVACGKNELRKRVTLNTGSHKSCCTETQRCILNCLAYNKKGMQLLAMFVAQKENYEKCSSVTLPGYDLYKGMKQEKKTAFSSKPFSLS